jgi:RNA polymerase sigma-70 factor (ECF subfamily)
MKPTDPQSDLLTRAQGGDRQAFDELMAPYRSRLGSVVYFRLGALVRRQTEVEDVLQETFLRALQSIDRFEPKGKDSFFPWLRQIAEHVILEVASRQKRKSTVALNSSAPAEDSATAPSRAMRREERFDRLQEALQSLSPDHKKVILLAKIERLPIKEIAVRMERSPDAVTNLLARALTSLKDSFGDTESFHLPDRTLEEGK